MKQKRQRLLASAMAAVMVATMVPAASASRLNELKYAPDKGITDTINYVGQLDSLKRVLFVGAHPDDESNSLLVYLNRKEGADAIYASLNWGEGGENSIGSELYGALGVLRSQELNSARMFDLADQMYGGAVDFGYSVSLKESLLGDPETNSDGIYSIDALGYNLAKIIRSTRPQVMFSHHKAPNTDHGQHRAAGWLIEYAIDLAADESYTIYDEDGSELEAWQVQKFFSTTPSQRLIDAYPDEFTAVGENSSQDPTDSDLVLDLGEYDPVLGMSYDEWGVLGRNMHKCQKMIGTPEKGESESSYILKKAAPDANIDHTFSSTIFGGLDVVDVEDWDPLGTGSVDYVDVTDELDMQENPVEKPEVPVDEPETPVEEPEAPVEEPEVPVEEPEAPVEEPEAPVDEPEDPVEEPEAPVDEPEAPVDEPEAPVEEPEAPADESGIPGEPEAEDSATETVVDLPQSRADVYGDSDDTDIQEVPPLETLVNNLNRFQDEFSAKDVAKNADMLVQALKALDEIEATMENTADNQEYARRIRDHITTVLKEIYAIDIDISVNDTDVIPGQTVTVTATAWARNDADNDVILPASASELLDLPSGWSIESEESSDVYSNGKAAGKRFVCKVTVPEDYKEYTGPFNAPYDEPYTNPSYPNGGVKNGAVRNTPALAGVEEHQDPAKMTAAMIKNQNAYENIDFGVTVNSTDPYSHSPIGASFEAVTDGVEYTIENEPEMRIVPKLSLTVNNESSMLKYTGKDIKSTIEVVIRNNIPGATGDITVTAAPEDASSGIQVSTQTVSLSSENQTISVTLDVTVPKEYKDKGTALVVTATLPDGEAFSEGYQIIDYDHINTQNYYKKAVQNVTVAEYQLPTDDIRIGFLKGGSDDFVFDYIRGMYSSTEKADANLKELSTADIAKSGAELAQQFDTIIIGKTALANQSPVSGALRSAMQNLLDYANAGGNLVLHYQNWKQDGMMPLAPVPFVLGNSNINKEDCDVYVNDAAAETPFYTGINKIDLERDGELSQSSIWDGWTQQRCEWTPGTADAGQVEAMEELGYTVLFEGQDPEGQMRPAILYKEMENGGHYTYSAVVWDRQLQALTPGAYKLYANLISMGTDGPGNVGDTGGMEEPDNPGGGGSSGGGGGGSSSSSSSKPDVSVSGAGGTASASNNGTVTIKPDEGYQIAGITVNGEPVEIPADGKLTGLDKNDKVVVTFEKVAGEEPEGTLFADVPASAWYADAVQYVFDNGMMNGTSATQFSPDGTTTRGMIVTILHRLEGEPAAAASSFTDVAAGSYYEDAVNWAAANGIVNGVSETSFAPNTAITREQMAAILYRYAQFKGYDVSTSGSLGGYADASDISAYAATAMQWANGEGLINGVTDTTLDPQGSATRAQVATILMRFCEDIA